MGNPACRPPRSFIPFARQAVTLTMGRPQSPPRKRDHLRIAAGPGVAHRAPSGLATVRMRHRALPERDLDAVALETTLLGRPLRAPLLVSAMTGGVAEAGMINARLAAAAAAARGRDDPGLGTGAARGPVAARDLRRRRRAAAAAARQPRRRAGRRAGGPAAAERLTAMLGADGLVVHLNPIQEAVQPEGEPRFAGVLEAIAAVVRRLAPMPVVAKEVGFGLDPADVALLARRGWPPSTSPGRAARTGRSSRAARRARRRGGVGLRRVGRLDGGRAAGGAQRGRRLPVIASGGLRDGVDAPSALRSARRPPGSARVLLIAAQADRAGEALGAIVEQLRIATWAAGAAARRRARARAPAARGARVTVVVVGAGLGGLGVALRLQGAGHDVVVVEAATAPAGAPRSCATPASRGTRARRS
jgi:isopentenyl-diphosphate delta-isomerase